MNVDDLKDECPMRGKAQIGFKDLSVWMKVAAIAGWCYAGTFVFYFIAALIGTL